MFSLRSPAGNAGVVLVGANVGVNISAPQASLDVGGVVQAGTQLSYGAITTGSSAAATLGNPASDRLVLQKGSVSALPYALGVGTSSLYASVPTGANINMQVAGANIVQVGAAGAVVGGALTVTGNSVLSNVSASGVGTFGSAVVGGSSTLTGPASFANTVSQSVGGGQVTLRGPTSIANSLTVTGATTLNTASANNVTVGSLLTAAAINVPGTGVINLGSDQTKEVSAGMIGYQRFDDKLDIVGAGTQAGGRGVMIYDNLYVSAGQQINGAITVYGTSTLVGVTTISNSLSLPNANTFTGSYGELSDVPYTVVYAAKPPVPIFAAKVLYMNATGTSAGLATFYPTANGAAGGTALFTTIYNATPTLVNATATAANTPICCVRTLTTTSITVGVVTTAGTAVATPNVFITVVGV